MTPTSGQNVRTLTTPVDYFRDVVIPNKEAFFGRPSTFATALNLATSLFHLHEWLYDACRPELEKHFGHPLHALGDFWKAVEKTNKKFGYIRDVTNASKHVKIGKFPTSTTMSHMSNTHMIDKGYGQGGYGTGKYGGGPDIVFDDAGSQISFDDCATELFNYWEHLIRQITGFVYVSVPATGTIQTGNNSGGNPSN
ncbi:MULTISPECIES: hypothetical protein [unclassified Ensifer]|uniref:hypothetical protein n=1 Tax=unclassified Ensifer TaxID=2633371 RepID=UPI00070E6895|nr:MULTISPECIES: hypothetical protein [unclassified Ensifer]KQW41100.1 hypothetical protein ASD02_36190 [Ensifer sp. Root1252]KRC62225.1 hypothetical protein ASE32_36285 [Ensifer sp. Root231]KRC91125.1 hypothetical protein ASE47_36255 [Ensifer sp. Root258]